MTGKPIMQLKDERSRTVVEDPRTDDGERCALVAVREIGVGSRVRVSRDGRVGEAGLVVGPDQRFFPKPHSVFVQFSARGLTLLIAVADLVAEPGAGEGL